MSAHLVQQSQPLCCNVGLLCCSWTPLACGPLPQTSESPGYLVGSPDSAAQGSSGPAGTLQPAEF